MKRVFAAHAHFAAGLANCLVAVMARDCFHRGDHSFAFLAGDFLIIWETSWGWYLTNTNPAIFRLL